MSGKDHIYHLNHLGRVHKVIDFVEQNLDADLSLRALAEIACISPFHFHRLFAAACGETLHEFVTRKRIERIAGALLKQKKASIQSLCLQYGFDNPVSFSRAFKKYYGISASTLRRKSVGDFNRLIRQKSKIGKETISVAQYIRNIESTKTWIESNGRVRKQRLEALRLAYVRNQGSFEQVPLAFEKLRRWALALGNLDMANPTWLMVIHDNPAITQASKIWQSAGLIIKKEIRPVGEVGTLTIPAGNYAVGSFELGPQAFKQAWDGMSIWMMEQGLPSRDGYYFEQFQGNSLFEPGANHKVRICIPTE